MTGYTPLTDDPGYVEARRDRFGPFVEVRWGQNRIVVRENGWSVFHSEIRFGGYQPAKVDGKRGWVRFEIDEGYAGTLPPVGWKPKALEVPELVWQRFVDAGGRGVFADLGYCYWAGRPPRKPPDTQSMADPE
ncbi:hypothetical protein ACFOY2_31180 [Nonomuraea purpurea]|uniref:Uncharacterized protein n=1 Tax=Nonomuraea purpurea TaxID=1849276 RepID=A0ABV8GFE4_9ACTN